MPLPAPQAAPTAVGYSNDTSLFLINLVAEAVQQFQTNQGQITPPPGYKQITAFQAPEISLSRAVSQFLQKHPEISERVAGLAPGKSDPVLGEELSKALRDQDTLNALTVGVDKVFFGFALVPDETAPVPGNSNVLVFRGTQTPFEWLLDATAIQVPIPLPWFNLEDERFSFAKVHLGFLIAYALLAGQVASAVGQFNSKYTTFSTGHSLGGALSTLAALAAKVQHPFSQVQLYNYASPRVGDPTFVSAFNFLIPASYRVVNMADVVPVVPPTTLSITAFGHTFDLIYAHVGQELSYLWQGGNVAFNHELLFTYQPTVKAGTVSATQPKFPTTAICP